MEIQVHENLVTLSLTPNEVVRLSSAMFAGVETISRAEYYIRTGLAKSNVEQISELLGCLRDQVEGRVVIDLVRGVEAIENPRRPRPIEM